MVVCRIIAICCIIPTAFVAVAFGMAGWAILAALGTLYLVLNFCVTNDSRKAPGLVLPSDH